MAKTVAFPVIGIGLDASSLKKGLADAKAAVSGAVADIRKDAQKLAGTSFSSKDVYALKPEERPSAASVLDVVDRFNQRRAQEKAAKDAKAAEKAAKAVEESPQWGFRSMARSASVALGKSLWGGIDSGISGLANLPATLSSMAMPLNQTLELAGKAQRLLGAPMRAQMALDANDLDVRAGGAALMGSATLTGTMARFESQVTETFADIWRAVDGTFDVQGLIEGLRGGMAGISEIIGAAFGPVKDLAKDPKVFAEQFKAGGLFVVDTFESIGKIAVDIRNGWAELLKMIRELPGWKMVAPEFNDQQEALIRAEMGKNLVDKMGRPLRGEDLDRALVQGRNRRVGEDAWNRVVMRAEDNPWQVQENNGVITREDAIKALRNRGALPEDFFQPINPDKVGEIAAVARDRIKALGGPKPNALDVTGAREGLEGILGGFRAGEGPIAQAEENFAKTIKEIDLLAKRGGEAVSDLVWESKAAAQLARDKAINDFQDAGVKGLREMVASLSVGGDAMKQAQLGYTQNLEKIWELEKQGGQKAWDLANQARAAAETQRAQAVFSMVKSFEGMQREAILGNRMMETGSTELIEAIYRANAQSQLPDMQARIAAATEQGNKQREVNNGLLTQIMQALRAQPAPAFAVGAIPGN